MTAGLDYVKGYQYILDRKRLQEDQNSLFWILVEQNTIRAHAVLEAGWLWTEYAVSSSAFLDTRL